MEASKVARTHQPHKKKPQSQDGHMSRRTQAELSDAADQGISDREVEDTPEDVYGRRREPLTWWLGKGALKRTTHRPAHEVRHRVAEKKAAEKIRDAMQPFHYESCLSVQKWTCSKLHEFEPECRSNSASR